MGTPYVWIAFNHGRQLALTMLTDLYAVVVQKATPEDTLLWDTFDSVIVCEIMS